MSEEYWNKEKVIKILESILGETGYKQNFDSLEYIFTSQDVAIYGSFDEKQVKSLNKDFLKDLNEELKKEEIKLRIALMPMNKGEIIFEQEKDKEANPNLVIEPEPHNPNLIDKYTFENFVVTNSNRMAHSFAFSTSILPGKSYNPLIIYGDIGLGKTHLLNAIGNEILKKHEDLKIIYLTSSDLMNEYVEYTRLNKWSEFNKKFTSIDILLVDEIQIISKWEGTSDRFHFILNSLYNQEKQVILGSEKHLDNIPNLDYRTKYLLEGGNIVEIPNYDLEGRIAILKQKISEIKQVPQQSIEISDEVLDYMASTITGNIRVLEGALNQLIGRANLEFHDKKNIEINLEFAQKIIKKNTPKKKKVTVEHIQDCIASMFNIQNSDLCSKSNSKNIAFPRQIAMYLCKQLTKESLQAIGAKFGGKHHSTVVHSIKKIEKKVKTDPDFAKQIDSYKASIISNNS